MLQHWGRMLVTVYGGHTLVMNFLRKSEEKNDIHTLKMLVADGL